MASEESVVFPVVGGFTQRDVLLSTAIIGCTAAFSWIVGWTTFQRSKSSTYPLLCWLVYGCSLAISLVIWLGFSGTVHASDGWLVSVATMSGLSVIGLFQIIANRICLLLPSRNERISWRAGVGIITAASSILFYCVWFLSGVRGRGSIRLHNGIEKGLLLLIDAFLNWYFMRVVYGKLLELDATKYTLLLRHTTKLIGISLSLDALLLALVGYPNELLFLQFQSTAYLLKLLIETGLCRLPLKITRASKSSMGGTRSSGQTGQRSSVSDPRRPNAVVTTGTILFAPTRPRARSLSLDSVLTKPRISSDSSPYESGDSLQVKHVGLAAPGELTAGSTPQ